MVLPAPSSPETSTTSPGPSPDATRAPSASVSAGEVVRSVNRRGRAGRPRAPRAASSAGSAPGVHRLARAPPGRARAARAASRSPGAGSRRATGCAGPPPDGSSGSRKTVRPPSSCTCGVPRTFVIPVGLPVRSFVAKLPSVAITRRLDQLDGAVQVGTASLDLVGLRVAVAGRAAPENVGDEHVVACDPDLGEKLRQQSSGAPHKRLALAVLLRAWALADEHQAGVGVTRAEHHLGPGLRQTALGAHGRLAVDLDEPLAALGGLRHSIRRSSSSEPRRAFWRRALNCALVSAWSFLLRTSC